MLAGGRQTSVLNSLTGLTGYLSDGHGATWKTQLGLSGVKPPGAPFKPYFGLSGRRTSWVGKHRNV